MTEPKFRTYCECGQKSPRYATAFTAEKWMDKHRTHHMAPDCSHDYGLGGRYCIHCRHPNPN